MFLGCEYSSPGAVYKGCNLKNIKLIQRLPTGTSSPRKTEDLQGDGSVAKVTADK